MRLDLVLDAIEYTAFSADYEGAMIELNKERT